MSEAIKPEMEEVHRLLKSEFSQISERLSQDLRQDLSKFLANWSVRGSDRTVQEEDRILPPSKLPDQALSSPLPSTPAQHVLPTPASHYSAHEAEQDIARMRMKARTYTSTEGICGPLAEGAVTLFGTPKNNAINKSSKGVSSAGQRAHAEDAGEGVKANSGAVKAAAPPRESQAQGADKRRSDRGSKAMREPRSIFLHHLTTNRPGEEEDEDDEVDDPKEAVPCKRESFCTCLQKLCLWLVCLEYFDYVMGLAILGNAVLMGVQADLAVQNARTGATEPPIIRGIAVTLGAVFTAELVIRILAYRVDFFTKPGWRWNLFDFLLVFLQLSEEVVTVLVFANSDAVSVNLSFMRILRVLRLVRIVRLVRVLRLIRELRTLVQSIASTMTSLLWTVVLLLLLIFVVGICFTQVVADVGLESPDLIQEGTPTFEYYGSLLRSVMSLYQSITSGVSWREASQPLEQHQPFMGLVFAVYIAFAALAMLNVITGVFVESAMASAREENNVTVVSRMRELVSKMNIGETGRMTWEQFESQLNNPIMEAYFRSLDLSVTEAESLFRLLDIDNEGSIDVEEFIAGCCRIHGPAKAIDLTTLMCQVMLLHRQWRQHANLVEEFLQYTGFLNGGETPMTMASASPASPLGKGTPRAQRRFSFCFSSDEKDISNENVTLELPELNEAKALANQSDASPRTQLASRQIVNASDKKELGVLPVAKPPSPLSL